MPLIILAQAKTHLNLTTSANDTEVQSFVDVACALVQGYADRAWDSATVTETMNGGGMAFLLRQTPVASVASVTVTGVVLATTAYQVDLTNGIITTYMPTTAGTANVSVVYVVGATPVPAIVQHATLETVRHLWQTQRGTTARNVMTGDEYVPGASFSLPRRVMELLDPVRNLG